ncbi:MAG: UTP--glucose-1-phosphate uridylyltransferase [Christensenellales bacterium]|jgi:UTP--glucose-1-phosphate uridylyltransferase|nr:UTP--glucose-1-phosphate uridylyltransferase [Clostridia bacterium]HRU84010.1 UTP--glucose-1-phosphate uridylyltransferase [Eubacteriales bacterium]
MDVKKAFIPAAGFGTRFLPQTKAMPKELLPIVDTPALQYIVDEAINSGITDILILLSPQKKAIIDYFSRNFELEEQLKKSSNWPALSRLQSSVNKADIRFAFQDTMLGTGYAINYAAAWSAGEPFAVLFGDDVFKSTEPVTKQLIRAFSITGTPILGVQKVAEPIARRCGVIEPGKIKGNIIEVKSIIEKPEGELPSPYASLGRFIVTPEIFDAVKRTKPAKNGEINLTDALSLLARETGVYACEFEGRRYDIGDKLGFIIANIEFGLSHPDTKSELIDYLSDLKKN